MSEASQKMQDAMQITAYLTQVSPADFELLHQAAPQARLWADEAVRLFYDLLFQHGRTLAVFKEGERAMREQTLRDWYLALLDVSDPQAFWSRQVHIAVAHVRRNIHNEYMIGISEPLIAWFSLKAAQTFEPAEGLKVALAFRRLIDSVVGLTAGGFDALQRLAVCEATGAESELIDRLVSQSVNGVQKELFS